MKIRYTEWGLANRFDDEIELNINLTKYPSLHNKIIKHELKHDYGKFTLNDFKHDLTDNSISLLPLIKFFWKHPKSLSQFLPIYKHDKHGWVYDLSLISLYSLLILLTIIVGYFAYSI